MTKPMLTPLLSSLAIAFMASSALAQSELDQALTNGGERLTGDEIAERFKGKTVTFVSAENGNRVLVYYGTGNEAAARAVAGDKTRTGFHAINDRDRMCLGWEEVDLPRLRCIDIVEIDGVVHKFSADGSFSGHIEAFSDGNTT